MVLDVVWFFPRSRASTRSVRDREGLALDLSLFLVFCPWWREVSDQGLVCVRSYQNEWLKDLA